VSTATSLREEVTQLLRALVRVDTVNPPGNETRAAFRLRVRGRSGHASAPGIADNALVKAAPYIGSLGSFRPAVSLIAEVERFFEVTLGEAPRAEDALARAKAELGPIAVEIVEPLLSVKLSPTMIEASRARNVIPAVCDVIVDCRLLPGQLPEDAEPDGFFPMRAMDIELAARLEHSADERVPVDDLELGVTALRHAALTVL
jgi:acetylornithine deacetylase/succinyl-diaminopimelate desuccinylase-like protein